MINILTCKERLNFLKISNGQIYAVAVIFFKDFRSFFFYVQRLINFFIIFYFCLYYRNDPIFSCFVLFSPFNIVLSLFLKPKSSYCKVNEQKLSDIDKLAIKIKDNNLREFTVSLALFKSFFKKSLDRYNSKLQKNGMLQSKVKMTLLNNFLTSVFCILICSSYEHDNWNPKSSNKELTDKNLENLIVKLLFPVSQILVYRHKDLVKVINAIIKRKQNCNKDIEYPLFTGLTQLKFLYLNFLTFFDKILVINVCSYIKLLLLISRLNYFLSADLKPFKFHNKYEMIADFTQSHTKEKAPFRLDNLAYFYLRQHELNISNKEFYSKYNFFWKSSLRDRDICSLIICEFFKRKYDLKENRNIITSSEIIIKENNELMAHYTIDLKIKYNI